MKVFAMVIFQFAILYCIALGKSSVASEDRATGSARAAEQRLARAKDHFAVAVNENRDVDNAKRLLNAAMLANFAAERRLTDCVERDWPYRALLVWPMSRE